MKTEIFESVEEIRKWVSSKRGRLSLGSENEREKTVDGSDMKSAIGFVPTMGGLHEGHVSLVKKCLERSEFVVVSVYVNPMQFAANEDFGKYPRQLKEDVEKINGLGYKERVCVFAPKKSLFLNGNDAEECARVIVPKVSEGLCASTRPHFFGGVATVVLKLFNIVKPDLAVFGKKDYQQLKVIEKMVIDFDLDVEILSSDIVREPTEVKECPGLAMSSRNVYLTDKARKQAECISVALKDVSDGISGRSDEFTPAIGAEHAQGWVGFVRRCIELSGGRVDYVEIRQRETLEGPVAKLISGEKYVVLVCAYFGDVRLLDNVEVDKA
mgnify:FL=1